MSEYKDVSLTAFIVNESRARLESLSGDIYAKLWVTEETKRMWEELAEEVYPYDHINLSLRNRFYLDKIKEFVKEHDNSVFINMGSGFTSYPYLIDQACRCIEIDYPHIINFKERKVRQWQEEGILPERSVEFYPLDIENRKEMDNFEKIFSSWCAATPTIIIMEGLTYYLSVETFEKMFLYYTKYLVKGSLVIFDFWGQDSEDYPVIQHVKKYLSNIAKGPVKEFTYIDVEYINNIKGFSIVEHTSIQNLEQRYVETRVLQDKENRFSTQFSVLVKN